MCGWLRGLDLNQRPSGYEPDELPGCSTPRHRVDTRRRPEKQNAPRRKSATRVFAYLTL